MPPSPLASRARLRYDVDRHRGDWTLLDGMVPESRPHDLTVDLLRDLLTAWALRSGRDAQVGRNLAIRWDEVRPDTGADPDIYVVEPPPPEGDNLESLRLWMPGHRPLLLAVEVVSASNTTKDYSVSPEKHAAAGTRELWIFDPKLCGPKAYQGPVRLQVWARSEDDTFERTYAGEGPAHSPGIGAWLFAVDEGRRLRIADDREGTTWWMTASEAERAERAALSAKDVEPITIDTSLARIAELEAALAKR